MPTARGGLAQLPSSGCQDGAARRPGHKSPLCNRFILSRDTIVVNTSAQVCNSDVAGGTVQYIEPGGPLAPALLTQFHPIISLRFPSLSITK